MEGHFTGHQNCEAICKVYIDNSFSFYLLVACCARDQTWGHERAR